jgi:PGF-pre-PGF domain-containing protein
MSINKETTISRINIFAKNTISNSQFSIKKLAAKPDDIPLPQNSVYSYTEITTDISDLDINNATITFEIPKSWLNNVDLNTVVMQRYHDNQWQSLETKQSDETDGSYIFNTISPGFSVFAITAKKEITFGIMGSCGDGTCSGNETKTNCCKDCGCEGNQTCSNNQCIGEQEKVTTFVIWLLAAVASIVIIRIGVAFWPKISEKFGKHRINRKFHPKK